MRNKLIAVLSLWLVAFAVNAATFTMSSSVYPAGQRDIGIPVGVLDTDTEVEAQFTRENWPTCEGTPGSPCNVMEGRVYVSVNGGQQQLWCAFATEGGDVIDKNGQLKTFSGVTCTLPPGTLRTVTINMSNTLTLSTAMTVTTRP